MMRVRLLLISVLMAATTLVAHSTPTRAAPVPGSIYLAAGDSLAYGYVNDQTALDPGCASPSAPGYVCVFYRFLKTLRSDIQLTNVSVPGADSCAFLHGDPGPNNICVDAPIPKAAPRPIPSQVDAIVAAIKAHPGRVGPITISIGGDDVLGLLPLAVGNPLAAVSQLPAVYARFRANLDASLTKIRAADAGVPIILSTQYNPLGGIGAPPLPAGMPQVVTSALNNINSIIKSQAAKHHATVADVAAAFDAYPGGASALTNVPATLASGNVATVNIHPTVAGYKLFGQVIIDAYSALPSAPGITARLAHARLAPGGAETVSGTTGPRLRVALYVTDPKRGTSRTFRKTSGGKGRFRFTFSVGRVSGQGSARVCLSGAAGSSVCTAPLHYRVA